MNGFFQKVIMESVIISGLFIRVIYCIVKKQNVSSSIKGKGDIIAKVIILITVAILVVYRIVPECMDLPYSFNNEFYYMEGVSQSHSDKSARGGHSVSIKDEDSGEEIRVRFGYKGTIEKGDWLKVKYLPNSRQAVLLEINGISLEKED